jgi:hypothetical protein
MSKRTRLPCRHLAAVTFLALLLPLGGLAHAAPCEIDVRADQRQIRSNHLELGVTTNALGHSLDANSLYFLRDGRPWLPIMGEIHYSRVPRADWDEAILKMKADGIDIIATYIFWIHHEEVEGQFDWLGDRSLRDFVLACQRHGVWVLPRIGPWCHGEVRNGGFPDWLLAKGFKTRSTDTNYLHYVDRLYREVAQQLNGLYFKDGGPVLGVQLENELNFKGRGGYDYMKELKRLAIAAGIEVPWYTCTGWPGIMRGEKEFLPMFGAYADAPWDKSTGRLVRDIFRFTPVREDALIGADLPGVNATRTNAPADNLYPHGTAELGGGVQVTYHQRYGDMHDLKDAQVEIVLKEGRLKIPEQPVTLAKDALAIWPFNFPLADARLIYATAQPLCVLTNGGEKLFVFFANGGVKPEFAFDAATVKKVSGGKNAFAIVRKDGRIRVKGRHFVAAWTVTSYSGRTVKPLSSA